MSSANVEHMLCSHHEGSSSAHSTRASTMTPDNCARHTRPDATQANYDDIVFYVLPGDERHQRPAHEASRAKDSCAREDPRREQERDVRVLPAGGVHLRPTPCGPQGKRLPEAEAHNCTRITCAVGNRPFAPPKHARAPRRRLLFSAGAAHGGLPACSATRTSRSGDTGSTLVGPWVARGLRPVARGGSALTSSGA